MLIRIILFFAILTLIAWGALWFLRFYFQRWLRNLTGNATGPQTEQKSISEKLIQCAYCHTFTPQSKAIQAKGSYYCSQEHANL